MSCPLIKTRPTPPTLWTRLLLVSSLLSLLTLCSLGDSLKTSPAADQYTIAQLAYQKAVSTKDPALAKDEFKYAEKKLSRFLSLHPKDGNSPVAYFYLANCQTKLGKKEEALTSYVEVIKRTNEGPQAGASALQVGFSQYESKAYESAAQYLELALAQLGPTVSRAAAAFKKALCHQHLNQDLKKEEALDIVLSSPDGKKYHNASHFMKGELSLKKEDYKKAYEHFKHCTTDSDIRIRAKSVHKCALLAQKLGDQKSAITYFSRVLKTPSLKEYHASTALIMMNISAEKEDWKSLSNYEKYGKVGLTEAQNQSRLLLLAKSYEAQGLKEKASSYYNDLATVSAGTTTGFEVSYKQLSAKNVKDANLEELEQFLSLYREQFAKDVRYESVKLLHAEVLFQAERFEEALASYQKLDLSLISEENIPTIAYRVCKISIQSEDPKSGISYINQFTQTYPNDIRGAYLLYDKATILDEEGEATSAIQAFMHVINHPKSNADLLKPAWLHLSKLHLQEQDYQNAIAAYEVLHLKHSKGAERSERAEWNFWLAYAQFKSGALKEAKVNFLKSRELDVTVQEEDATQYLALIAYDQKDLSSLRKEIKTYHTYNQPPLPSPLYLMLAIDDVKEKEWQQAWNLFTNIINPDAIPANDELLSPVIIETYAETALETGHYQEVIAATKHLKNVPLPPYRKAVNLYRSGLSHYKLTGATAASADIEEALLINPTGRLNDELLLLHGKIEMDEGRTGNATRILTKVYQFADTNSQDLKKEALQYLLKTFEHKPTPESQKKFKEYQKELEVLR